MSRLAAAIVAALSLPLAAFADPQPAQPAGGRIESDEGRIEILGRPVRVGERIELPEGFLRVEEAGPEDGEIGSFGVVSAESMRSDAPIAVEVVTADEPAGAPPSLPSCRAERAAYFAELWRMSGIEVSDPVALLDGLESGNGARTGYYWFALATDPFRPLAFSSELRDRAEALVRCVKGL